MPFFMGQEDLLHLNHEQFDFNIQFEQLFFSIIPSVLFIVISLWRMLSQARKPTVVNAPIFQLIKLVAITVYIALELSLLVLVAIKSFHVTSMFMAASVLKLVSALFMLTLSVVDHSKSPRPSVLLNSYLFLTLLLDAAQARTLFLSSDDKPEVTYSSVFVAAIALKAGILLLEAQQKSRWVGWDEKEHSPEETSGIFSLGVYFWLNEMFISGYRRVLTVDDLYPLDSSFNAKSLHDEFSRNMDYSRMKGKFGLTKVLLRTLKVPLFLPVLPRLVLLGFTFCQPLFIEKLLDRLSEPRFDANVGYGFIGASLLIYSGIAISRGSYWYLHHRTRTMVSSILVTETYIKATESRIGTSDDNAALTLMSTDIERIRMGIRNLHEFWASTIQAALAGYMLYNRLGVIFVAPIGLVIFCFVALGVFINFTGDSQRVWMAAVQKRVGLTATMISSMKNLKISGLSAAVSNFVQNLRVKELAAGVRWRKIFITAALLGYIPQLIGPPLTFAFTQQTLDASRVFTSLSFLTLLTYPLSQVFAGIPQLIAALACLRRIQAFLEGENRHDFRETLSGVKRNMEKNEIDVGASPGHAPDMTHPVIIRDGKFGWEADKPVLRNVNTKLTKSSLTIVVGPVGSGKSTFCKALLGEIPFSEGRVTLGTRFLHVGFCDQTAFLFNGSIRDNIVGFSPFNEERYKEVIKVTALDFDFATLPQGEQTNIGSDGIALSGGQKQRVSLARALYLQSEFLVLDDVFSGLDADTEEQVFRQVFGPEGLLRRRRSTVVLCTHSVRHLPVADFIIALGDGTIVEQGGFSELISRTGYVQRLGLKEFSESDVSSEGSSLERNVQESKQQMTHTATADAVSPNLNSDASRQTGDKTVYKHYARSVGWLITILSLFFGALWGFFTNFSTICG
ncbi:hypothetical protein ACMFMF_001108 [Clarireedia jacksonii]